MNLFRNPSLQDLKQQALVEAETGLLDAEAAQERAEANLAMLRKRVTRLKAAVAADDAQSLETERTHRWNSP